MSAAGQEVVGLVEEGEEHSPVVCIAVVTVVGATVAHIDSERIVFGWEAAMSG